MASLRSLEEEKANLRKELRQRLKGLGLEERRRASVEILEQLFKHPQFIQAQSLLTYIALASEVWTRSIVEEAFKRGKKVYVPRMDLVRKRIRPVEIRSLEGLKKSSYGILEPPLNEKRIGKPEDLDLVIVPGLGFDRSGGRIGRGKGYFDRFLREASKAYKIGLAFECQVVDKVPLGERDITMNKVLIG